MTYLWRHHIQLQMEYQGPYARVQCCQLKSIKAFYIYHTHVHQLTSYNSFWLYIQSRNIELHNILKQKVDNAHLSNISILHLVNFWMQFLNWGSTNDKRRLSVRPSQFALICFTKNDLTPAPYALDILCHWRHSPAWIFSGYAPVKSTRVQGICKKKNCFIITQCMSLHGHKIHTEASKSILGQNERALACAFEASGRVDAHIHASAVVREAFVYVWNNETAYMNKYILKHISSFCLQFEYMYM